MSDHARTSHQGQLMTRDDFTMEMTGRYQRALPRLLSEGIQVERLVQRKKLEPTLTEVLDSKLNLHQARPVRLKTTDQVF